MPAQVTTQQLLARVQQQAVKIAELELIIEALEGALRAADERAEVEHIASGLTAEANMPQVTITPIED